MSETQPPEWPNVVFRGTALHDLQLSKVTVAALARSLISELFDDELPIVQKLVVADYCEYGEAIRDALEHEVVQTHTNREQYKGVAITIPRYEDDAVLQTVVVGAGVVAAALGHDGVEPTMPQYFGRYLLQHEFAHCYDHWARKSVDHDDQDHESWFPGAQNRFKKMVLAEFVACWISGKALSDEAFEHLCQLDAVPLNDELRSVLRLRDEYCAGDRNDLAEIAGEALQCIWMVVVQHAKLTGHMIGAKRTSASVAMPLELGSRPEALAAMHALTELLASKTLDYPAWPASGWAELDEIWDRLATSLGFRFEDGPHGPKLWFD